MPSLTVCPYPACGATDSGYSQASRSCGCDRKLPIVTCGSCSVQNRAGAGFCRACGASLGAYDELNLNTIKAGSADFLEIRDAFRRPPVAGNGMLYAVSVGGAIYQLSPRSGATPRKIAQIDSVEAGFNRNALVNVTDGSCAVRGWTLLTVGLSSIDAVSLATGRATKIYEARYPEEMAVNRSEADSTGFKGLAANSEICAFALKTAPNRHTLALLHLAEDRPVEMPLTLDGSKIVGPALCGSTILLASERQAGMYDYTTRQSMVVNLPSGFVPLITPSSRQLNVSPGTVPLALMTAGKGATEMLVAGSMQNREGVLRVNFATSESPFRPLEDGSSISSSPDGSTCLRRQSEVEVFAPGRTRVLKLNSEASMPVFSAGNLILSFAPMDSAGQLQLDLACNAQAASLHFKDPLCHKDSCCAAFVMCGDAVVAYLNVLAGDGEAGMRIAHWSLTG